MRRWHARFLPWSLTRLTNRTKQKGGGGEVGLTENPSAVPCWIVFGPEMARVIGEFEASFEKKKKTDLLHREQTQHAQMISEMSNP